MLNGKVNAIQIAFTSAIFLLSLAKVAFKNGKCNFLWKFSENVA